jgi:hypothetical protein
MENSTVLEEFKTLENGSLFISSNFRKLQEQFADQYIAIEDNKVLANSSSFDKLTKELLSKNKQLNNVIIEFVPRKGIIVLY